MLTEQDIKKLQGILPSKEDFQGIRIELKTYIEGVRFELNDFRVKISDEFTKMRVEMRNEIQEVRDDIFSLREILQLLFVSVDKLSGVISDLRMEYAAVASQLERHERWIKEIAEKSGVKLSEAW